LFPLLLLLLLSRTPLFKTIPSHIIMIQSNKIQTNKVFLLVPMLIALFIPNHILTPLNIFFSQNCSIFNYLCTIGLNITKPPWCTPIQQGLPNDTKSMVGELWFGTF
jgi:hypothetical protein